LPCGGNYRLRGNHNKKTLYLYALILSGLSVISLKNQKLFAVRAFLLTRLTKTLVS
jgi:hypothetical protein